MNKKHTRKEEIQPRFICKPKSLVGYGWLPSWTSFLITREVGEKGLVEKNKTMIFTWNNYIHLVLSNNLLLKIFILIFAN